MHAAHPLKCHHRVLLKALSFTQSGVFVNTARIDPSRLYVDNQHLFIQPEKKELAIGIMTGTLTESFLIASAEAGRRSVPFHIHKVTIAPFQQDWRRDVSL
jgi:hypothetical protein